jgi:surface antigen
MKQLITTLFAALLSFSLVACSSSTPNQDVGTVAGAVAGGLLGSTIGQGNGQVLAIGVGALTGAYLGSQIGKSMDEQDRMRMNAALNNNSVGEPTYWRNAKTGTHYKVVATKNVTVHHNKYCREYQTTATINGQQQKMYGTACRQPDGSWKAVN